MIMEMEMEMEIEDGDHFKQLMLNDFRLFEEELFNAYDLQEQTKEAREGETGSSGRSLGGGCCSVDVAADEKKGWRKRRRAAVEEVEAVRELRRTRNRAASAMCFAKKQKYIKDLELQVLKLRRENALRKKILKFLHISTDVGILQRRLTRTTSGLLPSC